jgi:hypothetical protein
MLTIERGWSGVPIPEICANMELFGKMVEQHLKFAYQAWLATADCVRG